MTRSLSNTENFPDMKQFANALAALAFGAVMSTAAVAQSALNEILDGGVMNDLSGDKSFSRSLLAQHRGAEQRLERFFRYTSGV